MSIGKQYDIGDVVGVLESIDEKLSNVGNDSLEEIVWEMKEEMKKLNNEISSSNSRLLDILTTLRSIDRNTQR